MPAIVTAYDAVTVAAIPASAQVVLAYVDGDYVTLPAVQARFPKERIVTVTTTGKTRATLADVESGDLIPETGAVLLQRGTVRGLYSDISTETELVRFAGRGFPWWAADPTGTPHLVSSATANVIGTQYAWPGHGSPGGYDISLATAAWLAPVAAPTPNTGGNMPAPTDTVDAWFAPDTNGAAGFELHADGGLFAVGKVTDGALTYVAVASDGSRYHFGPNGDHAVFSYPALPAATRNAPRTFVRLVVLAYAGKAA